MLIDTHCHLNSMVKDAFDRILTQEEINAAHEIIERALKADVKTIINVGTSIYESKNCITLAQKYPSIYATVGIHPNDTTHEWKNELKELSTFLKNKETYKIVGIGECGVDKHYPDYNLQRQYDCFKAQIELALEHNLALIVHSRDAADETLKILQEYKNDSLRAVMHCFSYDQDIAHEVIALKFLLGIGATITYPKNNMLRLVVSNAQPDYLVLETDAPFLPPQTLRGKQNSPEHIATVAQYIAQLRNELLDTVAEYTTRNALELFKLQ